MAFYTSFFSWSYSSDLILLVIILSSLNTTYDHIGIIVASLNTTCHHIGIIVASLNTTYHHFGIILSSYWDHFGIIYLFIK